MPRSFSLQFFHTSPLLPAPIRRRIYAMTLKADDGNGNNVRSNKTKEPMMPVPRQTLIHLLLVALAILASTAMSYAVGGDKSNSHQLQQRQVASSPVPQASEGAAAQAQAPVPAVCVSVDSANPIGNIYPMNATGVLNATLAILPITMEAARRIIPAKYAILERPLRAALPDFPEGMYPVLLQAAHDHDVGLHGLGFKLPDFSRVGYEFPFIDLLGDGYSSFRWAPSQFLSADNGMAVNGSREYGTIVHPATFDPACDAFRTSDHGKLLFSAKSTEPESSLTLEFTRTADAGAVESQPYPVSFFRNITNQPSFADGKKCDQMIRLFNTTLSQGPSGAPAAVKGRVSTTNLGMGEELDEGEVEGIHVTTAFIENNYLDCQSLKGYMGTGGSGDSDV
ncbi:hypothetical protein PspLS_08750 [Pyricularia sp. CBS 133598]|nr:hypothetical protein PspLS_08750 [Pyricularia sp. CBS 133598]